jgi:hypothetical protein
MAETTSDDLLTLFDSAPLNRRYWVIFTLISAAFVFDFFDFLVVGYLLAAVNQEWHLGARQRNRGAALNPSLWITGIRIKTEHPAGIDRAAC